MLYQIGTEQEISTVEGKLPYPVMKALLKCTVILDYAYGPKRKYTESGGYSLIAETQEDIDAMRNVVDFTTIPCEWVDIIGDYLSALYLLNDDFSVILFMPVSIAPEAILHSSLSTQ